MINKLWHEGKKLPKNFGIYESSNRLPRNQGEIKMKKRSFNLWPEHDFGLTQADSAPKEILKGRRHAPEEERKRQEPQLLRVKRSLNRPFAKAEEKK